MFYRSICNEKVRMTLVILCLLGSMVSFTMGVLEIRQANQVEVTRNEN